MKKGQMSDKVIKIILLVVVLVLIVVLLVHYGIIDVIRNIFPTYDMSVTDKAKIANQNFNPIIWQDNRCPNVIGYVSAAIDPGWGFLTRNYRQIYLDKQATGFKVNYYSDPQTVNLIDGGRRVGTISSRKISINSADLGTPLLGQLDGAWIYPDVSLNGEETIVALCKNA